MIRPGDLARLQEGSWLWRTLEDREVGEELAEPRLVLVVRVLTRAPVGFALVLAGDRLRWATKGALKGSR